MVEIAGLTVAVGHGHAHVRDGLRQILLGEVHAAYVVEARNADEMETLLKQHHPRVIVLGDSFSGQPIQEQLAIFRNIDPSMRCIVLSGYPHESVSALLLEAGADAVIMEEKIIDDLVPVIKSVLGEENNSCRGLVEDSLR